MLDLNKKFYKEFTGLYREIKDQYFENGFCRIVEKDYAEDEFIEFINILFDTFKNYKFDVKPHIISIIITDEGVDVIYDYNKLVIFYEKDKRV